MTNLISQAKNRRDQLIQILRDSEQCLLFRQFLHESYSSEILSFFLEVDDYRTIVDSELLKQRAQSMYEKYFLPSKYEIFIDSDLRQILEETIKTPDQRTFDIVQLHTLSTLERDLMPKFLQSKLYRDYLYLKGNNNFSFFLDQYVLYQY
jgi:hypothetical protein